MDGYLMCKYGAQGGQARWSLAQIDEATHELVCSAHSAMPISLPVKGRIMRAGLWALLLDLILSEPGATFISDCAAVLRGLVRGQKWCTSGRRPHADVWRRIWERLRDIGEQAHTDCVTKCKAHLSKGERARLSDAGRFAATSNERADEFGKRRCARGHFPSCVVRLVQNGSQDKQTIISYIGSFILCAKEGERWLDVVPPPQGRGEKDERWKHLEPTLARSIFLCETEGNGAVKRVAGLRVTEHRNPSWPAPNVLGIRQHTLAVERLALQGKPFSWNAEDVHRANVGKVAPKQPRGQLRQSWAG